MTAKPENRPPILTHQSRGHKDGRIKVGWGHPMSCDGGSLPWGGGKKKSASNET